MPAVADRVPAYERLTTNDEHRCTLPHAGTTATTAAVALAATAATANAVALLATRHKVRCHVRLVVRIHELGAGCIGFCTVDSLEKSDDVRMLAGVR